MDRRKHYSQMTPIERNYVYKHLERYRKFTFSRYAWYKLEKRGMRKQDVLDCAANGFIIEVHNNKQDDLRVLLRVMNKRGVYVCVVVSMFTGEIVTVYENSGDDDHDTLDITAYTWGVDLVETINQMKANKKVKAWATPLRKNWSRRTSSRGRGPNSKR